MRYGDNSLQRGERCQTRSIMYIHAECEINLRNNFIRDISISNKVADAKKDMNDKLAIVNSDTAQAAKYSKEMVDIVVDVKNINLNALQDIEQIAMNSEEIVAAMQEVDSSVESIETMSKELHAL